MGQNDLRSQETVPAEASRVRYQVLAAACGLAVLTYIQRLGFGMGLPEIKKDLGLNDQQAGYLTSAFLVAYGIFQMPGGFLGDRWGGRHVLTLLVLTWSLLTGAVALTVLLPTEVTLLLSFLLVLRFLFGMAQAGGFPVLARVIADWMPVRERASAQGVVWMFSRLGGALVPFLFWGLFEFCGTWTIPFWILAGFGFLWCIVFWPWFRNRPEEMPQVNAAERKLIASGRSAPAGGPGPLPWRKMLRSRNIWALCLMYGCVGFAGNFFTNLLQVYLRDHRHVTRETTAWISGMVLAFGLVSCVLGGFLSDWFIRYSGNRKWGRRLNGSIGLGLAGLAFLASIWVEEIWALGLLFSVTFFFSDLNMGPAWAACADIGERYAGTLSGAMNMIGAFAGAAGMAIMGTLLDQKQSELAFGIFACSYGLAALCWLAVDVTKPLENSDAEVEVARGAEAIALHLQKENVPTQAIMRLREQGSAFFTKGAHDSVINIQERLKVALVDLDGQTVPEWVPQSLDREGVDLVIRQCQTREDLARHAGDAEVVWLFGGNRLLQGGNLEVVPRCWAILRTGSGTDNVPIEEATRRGIVVANTPAAFSDGVSDHVIALLFAVVRRIAALDRSIRLGRWEQTTSWPLNSVQARTLGLVGFGHIGREVTRKLRGFDLKVLAYDPYVSPEALAAQGAQAVSLEALLSAADFVSLHCPLTKDTTHLIGEKELRSMKSTAILLNTSRGPVIDEAALVRALTEGWIAAAGLDVFEQEPPLPENPLFQLDNVVLTPHAAGWSANGMEARWRLSVDTLSALARRQWPASCVNPTVQPRVELAS